MHRVEQGVTCSPSTAGRFMIGSFQGAQLTLFRTYIGETSVTVISTMAPEKREKSTLKYTNFFITFFSCSLAVMFGPGEYNNNNYNYYLTYFQ